MASATRGSSLRERVEEIFWTRHSNPWSGWTRAATSPVVIYAAIRRRPIAATVGTITLMALKLWFVDELVSYREQAFERGETG